MDSLTRTESGMSKNLEYYLQLPWQHRIEKMENGEFRCLVDCLSDFELYGESPEELEREWRTALRAMLTAYLKTGKVIPDPRKEAE